MTDEERYSNRQIEKLLDDQSKELKEHMDLVTRPILEQTLKTNGRVTGLEKEVVAIIGREKWQRGGLAVLIPVVSIFLAVISWMALQIIDIKANQTILIDHAATAAVNEAFRNNLNLNQK